MAREKTREEVMDPSGDVGHVTSVGLLLRVWAALTVLTVITVTAARFDFGNFNLWVALGIAAFKASLVVLYFMHLRYDRPFNAIVFVVGVVFVALFILFTLMDTSSYEEALIPGYAPALESP
ncbi:MAG: cytochrome C oxidase subunit IV family protein [Gemmatimonadota bacterium]|nr:cytochrome C oxidase subunit IV family protein [Gemmatimonadota bacterium]